MTFRRGFPDREKVRARWAAANAPTQKQAARYWRPIVSPEPGASLYAVERGKDSVDIVTGGTLTLCEAFAEAECLACWPVGAPLSGGP